MSQLQVTGNALFKTNVGIGTLVPQTTLSIENSGTQNVISPIITSQSAGVTYAGMYSIRDGAGDQRGLLFQNYTANVGLTEKMRITSGGNVGIGTISPTTRLQVEDSGNIFSAHFSGNNLTNGIAIGTKSGNFAVIQGYTKTFSATNNISINPDGGNVLIGTTTDNGARLQINGTSNFTGNLTINDGSLIKLGQGSSSNVSIDFFASNFGAGYEGRIMGLNSDGNTHFYHRNGSATFTDIGYFNNTGMYITYYGTYSDMRLKDVIETNPNIDLDGIDVIKYTLKSNPSLIRYGYSAQQVQSVLPHLVTLNKKIGQSDEDATLMLNYNDLYVLKIAALEKKLTELTEEVAKLK
jgi:hypothetical protein